MLFATVHSIVLQYVCKENRKNCQILVCLFVCVCVCVCASVRVCMRVRYSALLAVKENSH